MVAVDPFYVQVAVYTGAALCMGLGAVGAAIGEGYTGGRVVESINRQPAESGILLRTMVLGQAIAETSGIFALIVAIMILFGSFSATLPTLFALIGAGLSTGFAGLGTGTGAGIVSAAANAGIARQPETAPKETFTMVLGQAISQTTGMYALGISLILLILG